MAEASKSTSGPGWSSTQDLADRTQHPSRHRWGGHSAACCTGAGMRLPSFRFRDVAHMTGIDATESMIDLGRPAHPQEGLDKRISFVQADACATLGLREGECRLCLGEDAWCYVADKGKLIGEAARIVRPAGTIAFTNWPGSVPMSHQEAERLLRFMTFPSLLNLDDYKQLLGKRMTPTAHGESHRTLRPHMDLYRRMITMQLTYDAPADRVRPGTDGSTRRRPALHAATRPRQEAHPSNLRGAETLTSSPLCRRLGWYPPSATASTPRSRKSCSADSRSGPEQEAKTAIFRDWIEAEYNRHGTLLESRHADTHRI
ncbi:MAG: methyltransferase domain-containing protein [Acidimicrobiia bacterium]|nr:methyltransferase domain-containing protein [Acidimicrobiia bacterium]